MPADPSGAGRILPALEAQLAGLKLNDTKHVTLSAEDGYGPVNPEAFQEVHPLADETLIFDVKIVAIE